jgi:hypothetical protein
MPLDKRSFNDIYAPRNLDLLIDGMGAWCTAYRKLTEPPNRAHDRAFGFLGLLLVTWLGLRESDGQRNPPDGRPGVPRPRSHDCEALCCPMIADRRVQQAIMDIYGPDPGPGSAGRRAGGADLAELEPAKSARRTEPARPLDLDVTPAEAWELVRFGTLSFHRHGTTSIILAAHAGIHEHIAIKLILLPFLRIRSIARETAGYAKRQAGAGAPTAIVGVWASTDCWILMDFVDGLTLRELLDRPALLAEVMKNPQPRLSEIIQHVILTLAGTELSKAAQPDGCLFENASLDELLKQYDDLAGSPTCRQPPEVDLKWMQQFGQVLFGALSDLQEFRGRTTDAAQRDTRESPEAAKPGTGDGLQPLVPRRIHGDLTPSNIVMGDVEGISLTLIDLGQNYLYTQSMPGTGGIDSVFVSPEVRGGSPDLSLADVYSLGQLLISMGTAGHVQPGPIVPDLFYSRIPAVARFLEDLIQHAPNRRLTIFQATANRERGSWTYPTLQKVFVEEVAAVEAAEGCKLTLAEGTWLSVATDLFRPMKGAPWQQYRLWRVRRKQESFRSHGSGSRVRGLFLWSWVSLIAGAIGFAAVVTWFWRDTGWNWSGDLIEAAQKGTGSGPNQFPFLDELRAAGYRVPDLKDNWPARLVGITYVLVGARYYQALFAGLSPSAGTRYLRSGWRSISSEAFMRLETVTAMILVLLGTLVDSWWWPILTAIGQMVALSCNWSTLAFVQHSMSAARARNLSTVPEDNMSMPGFVLFKTWLPGSLFYAAVVWLIGSLIYLRFLHDIPVYAISVAAINIFMFYIVKCGINAPPIRVCLTRACLAAERIRITSGDRS